MRATLCPAQYVRSLRFCYRSAAKGAVQYNHSQKAPRAAAAGQPSDCKTLTDWARRIALAFEDDLEAGMQKYHGVLKDAVEVDGFPLTSFNPGHTLLLFVESR
eukprot:SAG25_NODE_3403_length_1095_cov_1.605422_1_plen_103_part_00